MRGLVPTGQGKRSMDVGLWIVWFALEHRIKDGRDTAMALGFGARVNVKLN
jgi:hypothetical protein